MRRTLCVLLALVVLIIFACSVCEFIAWCYDYKYCPNVRLIG